jgi:predicted ATPase
LLGGRAQHLLSTVPAFLKKRFEQLRRQQADEAGADDQPPSMAWSVAFARDMEQALLAELETRLQPIKGMVDALSNELNAGNS